MIRPVRGGAERKRSWNHRIDTAQEWRRGFPCSIPSCGRKTAFVVWWRYRPNSPGIDLEEVETYRCYCRQHAVNFARKHEIEMPT